MSSLGDRLKKERELKGWSQVLVAEKLGLKRSSTYANWEYGTREPDIHMLSRLSDIFDVSVEYLIGNTNIKSKNIILDEEKMQLAEEILALPEEQKKLIIDMVKALSDKR